MSLVHSDAVGVSVPSEPVVKPLRAYSVQTEEYGCVRFARSGAQARREGASEMDVDWESIESCRRAPEFDQYAPGPVPDRALWEAGWRLWCVECERTAEHWNGGRPVCDDHLPAADAAERSDKLAGDEGEAGVNPTPATIQEER